MTVSRSRLAGRGAAARLAVLAVLAALAGCATDPSQKGVPRVRPYRIHALGPEGSLLPHDQKVTFRGEGLTVGLQLLDDRERLAFLRERLGLEDDPFYGGLGEERRFVSFRLVIAASGSTGVHFQPQHVRLITDRNEHLYPLDLPRTYQLLRTIEDREPDPARLQAFTSVMYDGAEQVASGQAVEKLLVFKEPRQDSKEWILDLPFFQVGPESHSFRMLYAKAFLDGK